MTHYLANAFGPTQWVIILVIVLVLFGGSKIPEIMKGLGSGMKEFKKGLNEEEAAPVAKTEAPAPVAEPKKESIAKE